MFSDDFIPTSVAMSVLLWMYHLRNFGVQSTGSAGETEALGSVGGEPEVPASLDSAGLSENAGDLADKEPARSQPTARDFREKEPARSQPSARDFREKEPARSQPTAGDLTERELPRSRPTYNPKDAEIELICID